MEIKKGFPKHLMAIFYTVSYTGKLTEERVAIYNSTVVEEKEVKNWLNRGTFDDELNSTVVTMSKEQYENLFDHVTSPENIDVQFYSDLVIEQQGGII